MQDVLDPGQTEKLIAQRLLEARHRRGWTLAEAAEANGVSVTHLSRLERGERQPSIGVLIQLARSYGLPLGQLVGEEPQTACHVFRGDEAPLHDGPDYKYAALSGITGLNLLEAIRLELPGGSRTSRAAQHVGEEWLLVRSGRVRVEIGSESFDLEPGDAAHFDAQSPHRICNRGRARATVFIVSAGSPARRGNGHK
ncbi:helix-turn-helix domain-containing protein [Saccharopolyspora pogona]|uniref:helix-turn-helix domain-containing protein n=1 Tax=Saccharopolyspora pogona TaxID=333966 RepID=UPI001687D94A|nr:XRE family transcriptional regulator [Saccharopolyspora pogona]